MDSMYDNLVWMSDWNGYEVGFDDVETVGLYKYYDLYMYVDIFEDVILESWFDLEEYMGGR